MRTIVICLPFAEVQEVEVVLGSSGFERLGDEYPGRWNYPGGLDAVLYVTCGVFDTEFEEERDDIVRALGGRAPRTAVSADVSGRVPGRVEVIHLVRCLLFKFDGVVFDDYSDHAWTPDQIRRDEAQSGLRFFDYEGYDRRSV